MLLNEFEIHALIAANAEVLTGCDSKAVMREAITRIVQLIEMLPDEESNERTVQ